MLQFYSKEEGDSLFQGQPEPKNGSWILIEEAATEDLTTLASLTELDYSNLHDGLDKYELPRIEHFEKKVIVFLRYPNELEAGLYTGTLMVVITPELLATVTPHSSPLLKYFVEHKHPFSSSDHTLFLIAIFLKIVHEFTVHIRKVRHDVLRQEQEMIGVESEDIATLTQREEVLNQYLSSLSPLKHLLEAISSGRYLPLAERDHDHLFDLLNAVKQSEETCTISLKSIRSLRESYQIIFTNNVTKTIKLLTSLTIIVSIPTTVASIYGMNVALPFQTRPEAFVWLMGISSGLIVASAMIFQQKKWL